MRRFIQLVEAAHAAPLPVEHAQRVAELIGEHVHRGAISNYAMQEVMRLLPRPASPMRLWRVLAISPQQVRDLKAGRAVALEGAPNRAFQSWTKDAANLARLAADVRSRVARVRHAEVVVTEQDIPANQIVVDVMGFLDMLFSYDEYHDIQTYELRRYGQGESEVIVHHPSPLILLPSNTKVWMPHQKQPKIGDLAYRRWDQEGENPETIRTILDDQPDAPHGMWQVETDSDQMTVHWTGEWWEEVE